VKTDNHHKPIRPTLAMDDLFVLHVNNFVNTKPSHQRVMADAFLLALPTIDRWSRGRNLPNDLSLRGRVMGWIWNHNCICKCEDGK